ncbi:hypothetical protein OSB04_012612 [Centaurea solstitialis]|uniref:Phytocyanin domain-containing protein n=1 Tax=Centaurea solstitialis TaxID=347529 RepID=A0AA38TBQ5_9ASTR|nr:hypothetical protein OSB04_012612 [Centaurea solstitialis]
MGFIRSIFFCLISVLILFSMNLEAREFLVGGKENLWRISSSPRQLIEWAEKERFKIGDSLVFKYDSKSDSVLKVDEEDYKKCTTTKPLKEYNDGNTKIVLDKAGPYFFISGAYGNCEKGERLEVKVLSEKHSSVGATSPSPAPKPSPKEPSPPKASPPKAPSSPKASSSPKVVSPPVSTPAEAPKSSAPGLINLRVVDIAIVVMGAMVAIFMMLFGRFGRYSATVWLCCYGSATL